MFASRHVRIKNLNIKNIKHKNSWNHHILSTSHYSLHQETKHDVIICMYFIIRHSHKNMTSKSVPIQELCIILTSDAQLSDMHILFYFIVALYILKIRRSMQPCFNNFNELDCNKFKYAITHIFILILNSKKI